MLPLQVPDSDLLSVGSPGSLNLYDILDEIPSYLLFSCTALLLFAALPLPSGLLVRQLTSLPVIVNHDRCVALFVTVVPISIAGQKAA